MMRGRLILLFLFCQLTRALYADQAGQIDWHKMLIGRPLEVAFTRSNKKITLITTSQKNILAAINHKTGDILWRQKLDNILSMTVQDHRTITISTTDTKTTLRLWDSLTGVQLFQYSVAYASTRAGVRFVNDGIAFFTQSSVFKLNKDGQLVWTADISTGKDFIPFDIENSETQLYIIGKIDSSLAVSTFDIESGSIPYLDKRIIGKVSPNGDDAFFIKTPSMKVMIVWNGINGKPYMRSLEDADHLPVAIVEKNVHAKPFTKSTSTYFQLISPDQVEILNYHEPKNEFTVVEVYHLASEPNLLLSLTNIDNEPIHTKLVSSSSSINLISNTIEQQIPYAHALTGAPIYLDVVLYNNKPNGLYALIEFQDGSLSMIRDGKVIWTRNEYLTDIENVQWIDLPDKSFDKKHDELNETAVESESLNPLARYTRRLSIHVEKLRQTLPLCYNYILEKIYNPFSISKVQNTDIFGTRKYLVFVTRNGVVEGFDSDSGASIWKRYFGDAVIKSLKLSDTVLGVFFNVDGKTVLRRLNALTGEDTGDITEYDFVPIKMFVLDRDIDDERAVVLVSSDLNVHTYPKSIRSLQFDDLHFYLQPDETSFVGYRIDSSKNAKLVWRYSVPVGEIINSVALRAKDEKVASLGRILGNRSVLYKYLNPNLLSFITTKKTSTHTTLSVNLLDIVVGALLYTTNIHGAGPLNNGIHLIQKENWVVATYYNHGHAAVEKVVEEAFDDDEEGDDEEQQRKKRKRNQYLKKKKASEKVSGKTPDNKGLEILVLEIFESSKSDQRIVSDKFSSYELKRPHVVSQAYSFPYLIGSLGVTETRNGITTREILVGLENSNQLYSISKRILDPRRPAGVPSANEKEEGLIPYKGFLDVNPKEMASYDLQVMGIRNIISKASNLESTSLVCAYGQDIFFTRRTPSKQFDVLSEDFSRAGLIITIVALIVGIFVSKKAVARKLISDAWK